MFLLNTQLLIMQKSFINLPATSEKPYFDILNVLPNPVE